MHLSNFHAFMVSFRRVVAVLGHRRPVRVCITTHRIVGGSLNRMFDSKYAYYLAVKLSCCCNVFWWCCGRTWMAKACLEFHHKRFMLWRESKSWNMLQLEIRCFGPTFSLIDDPFVEMWQSHGCQQPVRCHTPMRTNARGKWRRRFCSGSIFYDSVKLPALLQGISWRYCDVWVSRPCREARSEYAQAWGGNSNRGFDFS